MTTGHPSTRRVGLWLGLIVLGGTALRLYALGRQATWSDELCRVVWAKGYEFDQWFGVLPAETGARLPPLGFRQALRVANAHNPPLSSLVLNGWMRITGSESDLVARLPSALLGILSILGAFLAARQLLGPAVGLWCAALVAASPFHVFYAQEVNHYTLAACAVAFSLWFYFRWVERPSLSAGAGLVVSGAAALYTHYYAAIVLLFEGVDLLLRHGRRPRAFARAALPHALIAVAFAPYLPTLRAQLVEMTHPSMVGAFRGLGQLGGRLQAMAVVPWLGERGEALAPALGVPLALLTCAAFAYGVAVQRDRQARRTLCLLALGPVVLVVGAFWAMRSNSILWSRYQLFFTFAQFMGIASALQHARPLRWIAAPALAVLAVVGLHYQYAELVKEDWKSAAAAIAARGSAEESVIVYQPNLVYAVARYLQGEERLFGVDGVSLASEVEEATAGRPATWFVSAWPDGANVPASVHALLACRFAERMDLPVPPGRVGLTVTRYSGRRAAGRERSGPDDGCGDLLAPRAAPWQRATGGPLVEAGTIDHPAPGAALGAARSLTVTGWAFSTRGVESLVVSVDGRELERRRHVGLSRPDVAAAYPGAPATHALHSGFWAPVDLGSVAPGHHALTVTAVHSDGSAALVGARDFTLAEPRTRRSPRASPPDAGHRRRRARTAARAHRSRMIVPSMSSSSFSSGEK